MPTYEMPLILRAMTKPETAAALKRIAKGIFDRDGVIRKIDNLGLNPTPHKISVRGTVHRKASYFIIHLDVSPRKIDDFLEECSRDVDLLRSRMYKKPQLEDEIPCTLHEEMLPPPYRPHVRKLMQVAEKTKPRYTHEWKWNSGLTYYPFQR